MCNNDMVTITKGNIHRIVSPGRVKYWDAYGYHVETTVAVSKKSQTTKSTGAKTTRRKGAVKT